MNILFLSGLYPPITKGGAELSTHYIARGLAARGHKVKVIATGNSTVESHLDGVNVIRVPLDLLSKPLFENHHSKHVARRLLSVIGDPAHYDVIHAHDFRSALALSHLNVPNAVVTSRDYAQISGCTNNILGSGSIQPGCADNPWQCHRVAEASFVRKPFRLWQYIYNQPFRKKAFASFHKEIFISHAQEAIIASYQPIVGKDTAVIYNPVTPEYLSAPVVSSVTKNVLYVGRVEMYKGVKLLLEAWHIVIKKHPDLRLHIVGEGAQQKEYEQLVGALGLQYSVLFKGKIPSTRMQPVYDNADIVVSPHLWAEPFGRTVVEGMARGKIVIAANCGGPAELIQDTKTGFLFERNSVQDLANKIIEAHSLTQYDKRAMSEAARLWVGSTLSLDTIAREHEEFYSR